MKKIIAWVSILIVIILGLYLIFNKNNKVAGENSNQNSTSTINEVDQEQKLLDMTTKDWLATTTYNLTYKYPKDFGTIYLKAFDWPPTLTIENQKYNCLPAGKSSVLPAGQTKPQTINGREYCITTEAEGAAGSTYTNYAYKFSYQQKSLILTFTTRQPQCMNYDDPQQSECLQEEKSFDIPQLIDTIVKTINNN